MHSILRQQEAQFVAVGGCGCRGLTIRVLYNMLRFCAIIVSLTL